MQTVRQRIASMLDWSEVDKGIGLMLMIIMVLFNYIASNFLLLSLPMSAEIIHAEPAKQLITHQFILLIGALLVTGVGFYVRKDHPNNLWLQYIASNYYSLSLLYSSYYIGIINFPTGVVLLGAAVLGFIGGNRRVIWVSLIIAVVVMLGVTYCGLFGVIPYAPMVVPPTNQTTHLIWTSLFLWFAAPHFLMIILVTDQIVSYWRDREDMVRVLSRTDILTGLCNRHSIMEQMTKEIARSKRQHSPLVVVVIDLDGFKKINDTWGHPVGDEILKNTAAIFKNKIRLSDIVGRYGGEEFLMILPDTSLEGAATIIERCRIALENAYICLKTGEILGITASFGLASNERNVNTEPSELIKNADNALYQAKANGRNRIELAK